MAEIAQAFVTLIPSFRGGAGKIEDELGGVSEKAGKKSGGRFGKVFASASISPLRAFGAAAVGLFAVDKLKDFFGSAIDEARESQKVSALTAQIIKSTGGAAKISAGQIGDLSTAISNKTGIDDEAIQSGANLLLTFKNVRNEAGKNNDVFNQATAAAVDLSAAGFGSITGASKQLGKALNDPIKGTTALSKAGVTFTDQQKEQIKALVASGDTLGAQKIILGEVQSQVGGAAAASATAGEKLSVAFGNFKEQIGTALLPVIDKVAGFLTAKVIPAVSGFITGIQEGTGAGGQFRSFLEGVFNVLKPIGAFILGTVVPAIKTFFTNLTAGGGSAPGVFQRIGAAITPVVAFITGQLVPAVIALVGYFRDNLLPIFAQVASFVTGTIIPMFAQFAGFLYGTLYPAVLNIVTAIGARLKPILDTIFSVISGQVIPVIVQIAGKFREWMPTIQAVGLIIVKVAGFVLKLAAAILGKLIPPLIKVAAFIIGTVVKAIVSFIGITVKIIQKVIDFGRTVVDAVKSIGQFVSGAKTKFGEALTYIGGLPGKIRDKLGNLATLLVSKGKDLISGLKSGVTTRFENLKTTITGIPGKLLGYFKNFNTLLRDKGAQLIQGLIDGILSKIQAITGAMSRVAQTIKDHLPGSPVKTGPLTAWNRGQAGVKLMGFLADGITAGGAKPIAAAASVAGGIAGLSKPGMVDYGHVASTAGAGSRSAPLSVVENMYVRDEAEAARRLEQQWRDVVNVNLIPV